MLFRSSPPISMHGQRSRTVKELYMLERTRQHAIMPVSSVGTTVNCMNAFGMDISDAHCVCMYFHSNLAVNTHRMRPTWHQLIIHVSLCQSYGFTPALRH